MTIATKEKRELLELASGFADFSKKHGWISRYDTDSDAFSTTVPKLSSDARIQYFDDEIAFYITKDNKIEGLFVEYFKSNFVEHHRELRPIMRSITKNTGESALVQLSQEKVDKIAPNLEEAIKSLLVKRLDLSLKS